MVVEADSLLEGESLIAGNFAGTVGVKETQVRLVEGDLERL